MIDLQGVKERLVQHLEAIVNVVKETGMPTDIKRFQITTAEIKNQNRVNELADKLPTKGNHIYWIEVDKPAELTKQFESKSLEEGYKYARDNKVSDSKHVYVYVGSCTSTKLSSRFIQHCGYGHAKTYSLQLSKWLNDTELTFTFCYVGIENKTIVQYLEDQLHSELKPLFGKSGGNNRIKKVNS